MICRNKDCLKTITNKRNAVHAESQVFCSHNCFVSHDLSKEKCELTIDFLRTRIGVLRQMKYKLYYLRRPHKLAEFDNRIKAYRQQLENVYTELKDI
jgi:hypothetical protein